MAEKAPNAGLAEYMKLELGLLEAFKEAEIELKNGINRKDWDQLEQCIRKMKTLSAELAAVEEKRNHAFINLQDLVGEREKAGFYEVIVHLPADEREALAELYRSMKLAAVGIRSVTYCIDEHLKTINGTLQNILNELFPYRKGNLYSKQGERREASGNPMVVNHSL
ncbi:MAG: flagellar export chaperone FlgN [Spirochaetales bacterium]|nr:flagellar export chaperone FlgN [Spirochaetales bacterium]